MIKTVLVAVVAGAFLISNPVRAEDKAPAAAGEKAEKKEKSEKKEKTEKKEKKDEKAGGW
jgi:ribosomal protein L12E/L44/L45/RPP1/RPP2